MKFSNKNIYHILRKIQKKKLKDYVNTFTPWDKVSDEDLKVLRLLITEIIVKNYIDNNSVYYVEREKVPSVIFDPIITPEGYKFMKSYRKQRIKPVTIVLDWVLRIIGAYAIVKIPLHNFIKFLIAQFF